MKTEEQLRKEFGEAQANLRRCELAFERAGDVLVDARHAVDTARFALEDFRVAKKQVAT